MDIISSLEWRYATKQFDSSRKITQEDLLTLQKSIQLTATSYGLQLYKVFLVEDPKIREQLKPLSWNQTQVTDASHYLVFASRIDVNQKDIDSLIDLKSKHTQMPKEALEGYGAFMTQKVVEEKSSQEQYEWTSKQAYIALGNLLMACASLEIDACPMEGIDPKAYDNILKINEQGFKADFAVAVGYRSQEDQTQYITKVRRPMEELFQTV